MRRPKRLDAEPTVFEPAGSGGGFVISAARTGRSARTGRRSGSGAPATTAEAAGLAAVPVEQDVDEAAVRRARQIAARLAIPRPRRDIAARRGTGRPASVRYAGGSDEIDIDATVDSLVRNPFPDEDDIIVREPISTARAVVLAVDISGSMRGERVLTAAATVGAVAAELARDALGVLAFWSDAVVLARLGRRVGAARLLEQLVRIRAQGLTNVEFPLRVARRELSRVPARDARVLLLSDCVHNAGPDPRPAAATLPRLDVLVDTSGEHDLDLARDLARIGRGRVVTAVDFHAVAPALRAVFTR